MLFLADTARATIFTAEARRRRADSRTRQGRFGAAGNNPLRGPACKVDSAAGIDLAVGATRRVAPTWIDQARPEVLSGSS